MPKSVSITKTSTHASCIKLWHTMDVNTGRRWRSSFKHMGQGARPSGSGGRWESDIYVRALIISTHYPSSLPPHPLSNLNTIRRALIPSPAPPAPVSLNNIGRAQAKQGRLAEAEATYLRALTALKATPALGPVHPAAATCMANMVSALLQLPGRQADVDRLRAEYKQRLAGSSHSWRGRGRCWWLCSLLPQAEEEGEETL